jgi:hypothetical protein
MGLIKPPHSSLQQFANLCEKILDVFMCRVQVPMIPQTLIKSHSPFDFLSIPACSKEATLIGLANLLLTADLGLHKIVPFLEMVMIVKLRVQTVH